MKVVLISLTGLRLRYNVTHGEFPPLGLAYIASILEKGGQKVKIVNLSVYKMSKDCLRRLIGYERADLYGLSSTLFGLGETIKLAKFIKEYKPNSKVILGGSCTVLSPEIILRRIPEIDIIVKGEGEYTMLELCNILENKGHLRNVNGISFRDNGQIINNPPRPWIENLDENPFPARHLLPNSRYRLHPPYGLYSPVTTIETSRGCASNCIFCMFPHRPYRCRSAKNVADEIELVVKKYGVREIYFVDPTFNSSEERTIAICEEITKRNLNVAWTCKAKVNLVSKESLRKMKQAGCYMISYGVESGSQEILDNLKKDITIAQIERAIKLTRGTGIRSIAYLMVGNPGETQGTIRETIKFLKSIEPDFVVYLGLKPIPVSELYQEMIRRGVLSEKYYEDLLFSENILKLPLYSNPEFSREDINKWVKRANIDFYFRPRYWLRRLLSINNINDLKNMARGFFLFISDVIMPKKDVIRD